MIDTNQQERNQSTEAAGRRPSLGWLGMKGFVLFSAVCLGVVGVALGKVVELIGRNRPPARFLPRAHVELDGPPRPAAEGAGQDVPAKPTLRVAVAPVLSPERSLVKYESFVHYLAGQLGRTPSFVLRPRYAETSDMVRYGQCDMAIVCAYPFVRGERDFGMEALAVPQIRGATTYHSLVLVPQSSPAASLLDLRGKRFASADIISNSGWLFPAVWLRQHGEDPDRFFGAHIISGSHDRSVEAVVNGTADGTAVVSLVYDQMAAEDPSILEKTKVILKSPPFGNPPIVVHPRLNGKLKEQLLSVLLNMHNEPEGQKVLAALRYERFVAPEPALFDSAREMAKDWEARK